MNQYPFNNAHDENHINVISKEIELLIIALSPRKGSRKRQWLSKYVCEKSSSDK